MRPRQTCPHCGEDVEQLTYCGNCGKSLVAPPEATATASATSGTEATGQGGEATIQSRPSSGRVPLLGVRGRRLRGRRPTVLGLRSLVVAGAAALAVVALLADEAGFALVVAAVAAPLILVETLVRRDVFDRMAPLVLLGVAAAGIVAGAAVGAVSVVVVDELWLDDRRQQAVSLGLADPGLAVASLGLGARAAEGDGSPPLLVLALAGLLLPAAGAGLAMAVPLYLRRWATYRNEVMDGVILGAAAGGGFAIGAAVANLWPLLTGESLVGDVPEWTVAAIGVVLLKPAILVGATALIGAGIWKYDLTARSGDLLVPLAAGLGWTIAYAFVSLFAGSWSPTIGLIWSLGVLIALAAIARSSVNEAVGHDRRWLNAGLIVCPQCRSMTPAGKFCSSCRAPLPQQAPAAPAAS